MHRSALPALALALALAGVATPLAGRTLTQQDQRVRGAIAATHDQAATP